ncbi:MAG: prenyltransferase/squalene oxidase repeat-containing protein, partial [Planctomycetota bacterium]
HVTGAGRSRASRPAPHSPLHGPGQPTFSEGPQTFISIPDAVDAACQWLLAHQDDDGRWDSDGFMGHDSGAQSLEEVDDDAFWRRALGGAEASSTANKQQNVDDGPGDPTADVGITGLALRALIADGRALDGAEGREQVLRGLEWLVRQQDDETGLLGSPGDTAHHYGHAIGTLALGEGLAALGETDEARAAKYRATLGRAVKYIEAARNPYAAWRYDSPPNGENDTSISVWMVLALDAARDAEIEVSADAFDGARTWFDAMTDPESGRVGYTEQGSPSSRIPGRNEMHSPEGAEALTAGALLARLRMGDEPRQNAHLVAHVRLMLQALSGANEVQVQDAIWLNWGTSAMSEIRSLPWADWTSRSSSILVGTQEREGRRAGSWDATGAWGHSLGRIGTTALMAHSLAMIESRGSLDPTLDGPGATLGSPASASLERPIRLGLRWLADHQDPDGRWSADGFMAHDPTDEKTDGAGMSVHDVGVTSLALMALFGDGSTPTQGEYRDNAAQGVEWLLKQQDPETGLFGQQVGFAFLYDHALASLAITNALHLTGADHLRAPAQSALNFIASCRNPYGVWRYSVPPDGDNDTSLTSWMMQVIRSGQDAGLKVDLESWSAALAWLDEMTDPASGRIGYTERGSFSARVPGMNVHHDVTKFEALTAAGLYTRLLAGEASNGPTPVM